MNTALAANVSATQTEDGGMVLLDQRTGRYWQLNPTGAAILGLVLSEGDAQAAVRALVEQHPAAAARIPADVTSLVRMLRDRRLVTT
ncbi:lasso peptide biosynthesis PqqD family chaperone [Streptomyces sp. NBC_00257]|uniref:lasso peptide biosynthesis PqqD family chaperone n=1 Tax=unclassified Streptomyces TaxID=2593676 RepID=UPI002258D604|nr:MULTISPECIES: lasso peptide biosynthesis PqqD family chaperone [unclassified Streptomyces]MCX4869828.1 lasso peptide biosynthesis PqqD family chaperone [Streptomyces sp. NBC_00906]MCX4900991.1 lasso peptide biosynthesis PqqD family chaperone [Streptomyces sp. NBC_00892]MCX5426245.1 lasso peptide biosynthesis PqqD family chaperone [Streptomyces sp. NBC_00062]